MVDEDDLMPWDLFEDTVLRNPYIVQEPSDKQIDFLRLENKYALYGGAGAGGKSSALLMAALQFCHDPIYKGYAALIVRRNLRDLEQSGGLIQRALEWLDPHLKKRGKGGRVDWNGAKYRLTFPNRTSIQFGYCDNAGDEHRYHGAEYQLIALDEAAQFTPEQLAFFMTERLRKTDDIAVPLRFRAGTTPGGPGHAFLKDRFIDPGTPGYVFLHATIDDNVALPREQYEDSLAELKRSNPLRYRQMLVGDWDAVEGGRFKKEWFGRWRRSRRLKDTIVLTANDGTEVERFQPDHCGRFIAVDPAAGTGKKADYFVAGVFLITPRANVVWLHCHRDKHEIPEQVGVCKSLYRRFQPQFIAVEEVMSQRGLAQILRRSTDPVMVVRSVNPGGKGKLERAAGFIALASSGRVFLPESDPEFPLADVIAELLAFQGDGKGHDDVVDVGSYMTSLLPFVRQSQGPGGSRGPFRYEPRPVR